MEFPPHECAALGCRVTVAGKFLMCPKHWNMVPRAVQTAIWREFFSGQRKGTHPTEGWRDAMAEAITEVDRKEKGHSEQSGRVA
jgi:hypothetical protein